MRHSKLPLTGWFSAAYLMATHSNGISALQLQRQLAFGSYNAAWLICAKLRCSTLAPGRSRWPAWSRSMKPKSPATAKTIRSRAWRASRQGEMLVVGAVEVEDGGLRPPRPPQPIADFSAASLHAFLAGHVPAGATAKTNGGPVSRHRRHHPRPARRQQDRRPHRAPPGHRIFSNLKVSAFGIYHGLRRERPVLPR